MGTCYRISADGNNVWLNHEKNAQGDIFVSHWTRIRAAKLWRGEDNFHYFVDGYRKKFGSFKLSITDSDVTPTFPEKKKKEKKTYQERLRMPRTTSYKLRNVRAKLDWMRPMEHSASSVFHPENDGNFPDEQ